MTYDFKVTTDAPGGSAVEGNEAKMREYAAMAKKFMNKPFAHPNDIVGNFAWHEKFPYDTLLVNRVNATDDELVPALPLDGTKVAVDFGCGPGRMINRFIKTGWFKRVDGIDISDYALDYAREQYRDSVFYVSSGIDVGDAPTHTYDFLYSTIAIQHISCWSIRNRLYVHFKRILKPGGELCLQLAYHPTHKAGRWSADTNHASYESDYFDAQGTNGHADMIINQDDLPKVKADFEEHFNNVQFTFANVADAYNDLDGEYHAPYWASHWLFVHATN